MLQVMELPMSKPVNDTGHPHIVFKQTVSFGFISVRRNQELAHRLPAGLCWKNCETWQCQASVWSRMNMHNATCKHIIPCTVASPHKQSTGDTTPPLSPILGSRMSLW